MLTKQVKLPARDVSVLAQVDVIVVGGGFPGACAALGAARAGARVALVEQDGLLGGQAANMYTFGLNSFVAENGRPVIKGLPWEIVCRSVAEGQSEPLWDMLDYERMDSEGIDVQLEELELPSRPYQNDTYVNPGAFRYVLQNMVDEEGIVTFLESRLSDVLLDGDQIRGIVAMGAYGPFAIESKVVVDTTPQAAVAALAGHPFPHPEVYTGTHPRVAGVDIHLLIQYIVDNPNEVRVRGWESVDRELLESLVERDFSMLLSGFASARKRAIADDPAYAITGRGEEKSFTFLYDRDGCGSYWIKVQGWGRTRLDDPLHLSQTIAAHRKSQWLTHKLFREYVPGFERAHLMDVYPHISRSLLRSRETSEFNEYGIPWEHIEKDGALYEDSVARIIGHPGMGQSTDGFQIPYRSLIPRGLGGLLVTGKPACRTVHIHATCAAVGQAAGVAAAIASKDVTPLRELDVAMVQEELQRQGAAVF